MARSNDPDELDAPSGAGGISAGLVVGMVLGGALALFVAQNTKDTTVKWLTFEVRQPLWVILLVTAAVTLVVVELIGGTRRRRKRKSDA